MSDRARRGRPCFGSFIHEISTLSGTLLEETRCSENRIPCCSVKVAIVLFGFCSCRRFGAARASDLEIVQINSVWIAVRPGDSCFSGLFVRMKA